MPELPEVERAAKMLRDMAKGKRIESVETFEDAIVFSGTTHEGFKNAVIGRVVGDAQRYGKVFYMTLGGKGKHPVLHFGMTGMLQVRGNAPSYYRENGRKKASIDEWPPGFTKFVLRLVPADATEASSSTNSLTAVGDSPSPTEIAFLDPRRLARIRLCSSPLTEAPISELGFDPILSMPPLETFAAAVHKRSCPIKALLLDQSFSAGVGNWVADEILYHARVHPEQRCNTLSNEQINEIYKKTIYVPRTAVDVNADDSLFPDNWLFKHRWGKGKKKGNSEAPLLLPSGETATIKWVTVGGRTSAFVVELQSIWKKGQANLESAEVEDDASSESDLTPLEESSGESSKPASTLVSSRKRRAMRSTYQVTEILEPEIPAPKRQRRGKK